MKVVIKAENSQLVFTLNGSCLVWKISIHDIFYSIDVMLTIQLVRNKCVCAEAGDQRPLENRVASLVDTLERSWLLLHLLVISTSLDEGLQHTTDNSHASRAQMVSHLGNREPIHHTARAVERFRRDVVLHHDAREREEKVGSLKPSV